MEDKFDAVIYRSWSRCSLYSHLGKLKLTDEGVNLRDQIGMEIAFRRKFHYVEF